MFSLLVDGLESRPTPPSGVKRQASVAKSNLDRVYREKQHLQNVVQSLRHYFLKLQVSTMDLWQKRMRGGKDCFRNRKSLRRNQNITSLAREIERTATKDKLYHFSTPGGQYNETEEKLRESELLH